MIIFITSFCDYYKNLCYDGNRKKKGKEKMNETLHTIFTRRSIKKYQNKPLKKEILEKILEAGTYAPSGMNQQSPIIIAISNPQVRNQLMRLNAKIMGREDIDPFYGAPVVLVVLADKKCPTYLYDGALVMENLMLAAHSFGIGSCWIHRAKEEFETEEGRKILKDLGIEGDYEGIGHCILGYADQVKAPSSRKENYIYYID